MWQEQFEVPEKVTALVRIQEFDLDRILLARKLEGDKIRFAVLYNVRQVIKVRLFAIHCCCSEHVLLTSSALEPEEKSFLIVYRRIIV